MSVVIGLPVSEYPLKLKSLHVPTPLSFQASTADWAEPRATQLHLIKQINHVLNMYMLPNYALCFVFVL